MTLPDALYSIACALTVAGCVRIVVQWVREP